MSVVPSSSNASTAPFELRNATLTLPALVLRTGDLDVLARALEERFGPTPALFDQDPVVIDLAQLDAAAADRTIDFERLGAMLRTLHLVPVGVEGGSPAQMEAARAAGYGETATYAVPTRPDAAAAARAANAAPPVVAAAPPPVAAAVPTLVIDRPLRSGQQVYARNADLVVMAAVNFGAEVIADGHIHVYAPLRGRAIAGARGNTAARIFSTCMEPQLVSIAGTYRTTDTALPENVQGKAAQVRLDGETLVVEPLLG